MGLLDSAISVLDELVLNNLHIVIRQCQNDNVLLSAVMFSFLSHLDGNHQYVGCHNYALANLRRRMGQGADAASDSTMAAILLLAGKEVSSMMSSNPAAVFRTPMSSNTNTTTGTARLSSESSNPYGRGSRIAKGLLDERHKSK